MFYRKGVVFGLSIIILFFANKAYSGPKLAYNEPNTIGSHLMRYFVVGLKYSMEGKKIPEIEYERMNNDKELALFYKALPRFIELTQEEIEILRTMPQSVWSLIYTWYPIFFGHDGEEAYKDYHKIIRSVSKRIVQKALTDVGYKHNVNFPVIHYRLGDVPFCRQRGHHLNRYSYFLWALEKVATSGVDTSTVVVVTSNKHHSDERIKDASELYLKDFLSFLNQHGYTAIVQSESVLYDFATLVFAPATICSSNGFSFMAGIANNGIFLCPKLGTEKKKVYFSFNNCEWMYMKNPIFHFEIKDYFDVESVLKKLKEE